ncbi:Uncharacterised protein [Serratia rubidaea]|uniref:DUF4123 domain-containing protein n=1 Tax=Serratia rubidaea TaxID=61652 RepID=A0A4V6JGU5_SERRU|nr:DUF4123 domain-containing protein [Serratia rubidaea]MBD8451538.1 DUF4123 domain-containing protein [Serratia rubidaea]QPR62231.1 DUF4123 domain-containing protein [Serratia rubidaea]CAI1010366.1 Uncharacterised protein [Serratia rubidaea]CAI1844168.1 Uncharacterised protein [Serratia rubidaea]VTP61543.1 Uncharacterised protein [Serratia rubidaea]
MRDQHYAFQALTESRKKSDVVKIYALVDGIQYERAFGGPIEENKIVRPLLTLPEDRSIAFAGPWLMDAEQLSMNELSNIFVLEKKHPAVSWIVSEKELYPLAAHLTSCLMISFPSKETGLFRFYDCRVLLLLPQILLPFQIENLMKLTRQWLFLSKGAINSFHYHDAVLKITTQENKQNENRDIL